MAAEQCHTGTCQFCDQIIAVNALPSLGEADLAATDQCKCPGAKSERWIAERINDAIQRIDQLFGAEAQQYGFLPIKEREVIDLLETIAIRLAHGLISGATVRIRGSCTAKISLSAKGKIKIQRTETNAYSLEAGE